MKIEDQILIEKLYVIVQSMERLEAQATLKSSAAAAYTYSYTHQVDLGQGRTRFIHLTFRLNAESGQLELASENISDA